VATLNYVSVSDLKDVMPEQDQAEATDDISPTNPTRDEDMLERFLIRAESRVESYLVGYELPLDPAPAMVDWAVLVCATYMLYQRGDLATSEEVKTNYDEIMEWLNMVRKGDATLPRKTEDDDDFVGFGQKDSMIWGNYPHRDYILTNW